MNSEKTVKHQRVVTFLQEHRLGAVLLSRRCNFSWYTCGAHNYVGNACEVGNSHLLVHKDGAMLLANNIEAARLAGEELADGSVEIIEYPWHEPSERDKAFKKAIAALKIAVDAEVPGVNAPLLGGDFDCLRWSLTAEEIDRYRKLCTDTVGAVESTAESAKRGMSEWALAGRLHSALMERCCLPWVTLVAGDERVASYRHPLPTGKKINRYFMLVTCAERDGLLAACTRLASFGPLTSELVIKHRAVAGVDAAMISSTRPGATMGELFEVAKAAYAAAGFPDEWKLHHQGGSCGYQPRDVKAAPGDGTVVLADQAFAWNPSISGTKCEDTILCRQKGPEILGGKTDWPTIKGQWKGASIPRPDILVL